MAADNKSKSTNRSKNNKKTKQRFLPHNKAVKKGSYPLRPGVQGFFITCDGGRERQASHEAINVIDSFYEELVHGRDSGMKHAEVPNMLVNKKTKFKYSDSSSSSDDDDDNDDNQKDGEDIHKEDEENVVDEPDTDAGPDVNHDDLKKVNSCPHERDDFSSENQIKENKNTSEEEAKDHENQEVEGKGPLTKKQCLETDVSKFGKGMCERIEEKSVDKLIEAELAELGDRSKRRFSNLDSGCNGVVFVQMRKIDGDPSPKDIVQHMMTSVASTKKHVSRFMLRVLPIEVSCYASSEEITTALNPLIARYFSLEAQSPHKFAVLYDARANTGIDRMKIINAVAKSVPGPHKVDLNNPDINIVVQIVKTVCLIGVVQKYKELAKYNLRQLTSSKP